MPISAITTAKRGKVSAWAMTAMLGFTGTLHFVRPQHFDRLVTKSLPGTQRQWVLGSGVAELAVAALVAAPKTRRLGGRAATLLFLGVFPANLKMAWDFRTKSTKLKTISLVRLPMQAGLIAWSESIHGDSDS